MAYSDFRERVNNVFGYRESYHQRHPIHNTTQNNKDIFGDRVLDEYQMKKPSEIVYGKDSYFVFRS